MAHYFLYWKPEGLSNPNQRLHWAASAHLGRVQPGDVLWAVSRSWTGESELVARIEVSTVTQSEAEVRERIGSDDFSRAEWYAIGSSEDALANPHIPISRNFLFKLRFEGLHEGSQMVLHASAPTGCVRHLTEGTVPHLEDAWAEGTAQATSGRRKATWHRDELILALDLYMRLNRYAADDGHLEVMALSHLLNELPVHTDRPAAARFRSAYSVALTLRVFRAIEQGEKSVSAGNHDAEQIVWDEFEASPVRLRSAAQAIRAGVASEQHAHRVLG
jgi:hypothetical protein